MWGHTSPNYKPLFSLLGQVIRNVKIGYVTLLKGCIVAGSNPVLTTSQFLK
jgi:hypothetical protein